MIKMLILMYVLPPQYEEVRLLKGELNYWDNQFEEMQTITPKGRHQIGEINETTSFYYKKRSEILNSINDYETIYRITT